MSEPKRSASWHDPRGLGYFLAVVLHKPFDSLSIVSLMHMSGWSARAIALVNMLYAVIAPLGILLFYFGINKLAGDSGLWLGGTMAFAAGGASASRRVIFCPSCNSIRTIDSSCRPRCC